MLESKVRLDIVMNQSEIRDLLNSNFEDSVIEVTLKDSYCNIFIASDKFKGLSKLKCQQMVYSYISEQIASGSIHAVELKLKTLQEYRNEDNFK